jgi:hypothetical protein
MPIRISETRSVIASDWQAITERARVMASLAHALPNTPKLLGSSTKTVLGEGLGILTRVVYLAPASSAFGDERTLCPFSTEGCRETCLGEHAGRMIQSPCERARLWKTALYMGDRGLFRELLIGESRSFQSAAIRAGMIPAVRVDGSSDTGEGVRLARALPTLQCYDYTKSYNRAHDNANGAHPDNYHVTFSYSGFNERDARFLDPRGVVVGLRFKQARNRAAALRKAGPFVIDECEAA